MDSDAALWIFVQLNDLFSTTKNTHCPSKANNSSPLQVYLNSIPSHCFCFWRNFITKINASLIIHSTTWRTISLISTLGHVHFHPCDSTREKGARYEAWEWRDRWENNYSNYSVITTSGRSRRKRIGGQEKSEKQTSIHSQQGNEMIYRFNEIFGWTLDFCSASVGKFLLTSVNASGETR